jgi:rubrerythrin
VPLGLADELTPAESRRIARSIATFQLGEQSDGRGLLAAAERFARMNEMPDLVRIIELLIREEGRHASLLRGFMQDHRMPSKRADWTDGVFRRVRRLAGLELYLNVLIAAELIGNVYYRALESATNCARLQALCRGLVADELAHVGFESELLQELSSRRGASWRNMTRGVHRIFFAAAASVVWATHQSVLRGAGHGVRSFLHACLAQYAFYLNPAQPALKRSVSPRTARASSHRGSFAGTVSRRPPWG